MESVASESCRLMQALARPIFKAPKNRASSLVQDIPMKHSLALKLHSVLPALAAATTVALLPIASQAQVTTAQLDGLRLRNIGPAVMSGRIVDLAVAESDPIKYYVASATGGVYKTSDNGITLDPVFENEGTHSVGAIALHQADTSIVWVGTGERANRQSSSWGDGVYKSTDGGETWTNMGLRDSKHIGRIALHPDDTELVYVAAMGHLWGPNEERGLYRSTDGGATWQPILQVDENTGAVDVALDPDQPNIVYAATYQRQRRPWGFHGGGPGSALHRSMDGGDTWERLTGPGITRGLPEDVIGRIGISIYRSDPRIVYVSVEQGYRYNASTAYTERRAGIYRSEDRGDTWELMSDWNPRPMYASQITVDPSDDQRIYMVNSYSFSDDGGRTFTVPPQSLHGDDRLVWVNPSDSRHVMKADDGGLGISYDRGLNWLYISDLPVSQYYRVSVDMAHPYNVYGGLQDNGSWMGPSETWRQNGIVNSDWTRLGGGDGFINLADTTNNTVIYTESQYLGLSRFDTRTGERTAIRPGDPVGHIAGRRNWETWREVGTFEEQRLGNAMAPANWDGPFIISPHDASTLYAGTNIMWRTTDRGDSWQALGDLTTGTDRRSVPIMGQMPDDYLPSLDDGIPYWPTISAVSESPLRRGLIYAGTDDGRLHVSHDGGERWIDLSARDISDSGPTGPPLRARRPRRLPRPSQRRLGQRHRAIPPRRGPRLRRLEQLPQRRLRQLPLPLRRLRPDLGLDHRRPARRPRAPDRPRRPAQPVRPLPGRRNRPLLHHGRRHALDRTAGRHAHPALQRPRHPSARERPGAGDARPRHLDPRSDQCAPGAVGGGGWEERPSLHHRACRADPPRGSPCPHGRCALPGRKPPSRRNHRLLARRRSRGRHGRDRHRGW